MLGRIIGLSIPISIVAAFILFFTFSVAVKPGEVAIKVDMYGGDKGVQSDVLTTGRNFYNVITHDVVRFPVYVQQAQYEGIQFQDVDGLIMSANVALAYQFSEDKVSILFEEYRKTPKQITIEYFPIWIRDAMVRTASDKKVDFLYGAGKEEFRLAVRDSLRASLSDKGIVIDDVYFTDGIGIPKAIRAKVDAKIQATQIAEQKENELQQTQADVAKQIAVEEGKAKSRIIESESRRQAIENLSQTLTPAYLQFRELEVKQQSIEKWDGSLPRITGSDNNLLLDVGTVE